MPPTVLARLRNLSLALPESHEVEAWSSPTFRVKGKIFAMFASANDHHGGGKNGVWIKATAINQGLMLKHSPDRFFFPPYVGKGGWIGVWLNSKTRWGELRGLLEDAYRMTAPKRLAAAPPPSTAKARRQARPKRRG